jgi:hypothetical protein
MSEQTNTTTKTIKIPGPDHPITIERNFKRVVVSVGGVFWPIAATRLSSAKRATRRCNTFRARMSTWRCSSGARIPPIVRTRVTAHTSASHQVERARSTRLDL